LSVASPAAWDICGLLRQSLRRRTWPWSRCRGQTAPPGRPSARPRRPDDPRWPSRHAGGRTRSGLQEGQSDARSPVMTVDGETRDPPDSGVIGGEHSRKSLAAGDTREGGTGSYPGPSGGMIIDAGDESRRYHRARDLLAQRVPIVWCRFCSRVFRCCRAEEELTPAPRRVLATPAEHRDQVTPPIRSRGTDIDGHDSHHRARPGLGPR
jgi:hypothetical protein